MRRLRFSDLLFRLVDPVKRMFSRPPKPEGRASTPEDLLRQFVEELQNLSGAFEIARACLRYAFTAWEGGHDFNNARVEALAVTPEISLTVTGHIKTAMTSDVLERLGRLIASSADPPLAAWWAAESISVATDHTFSAHVADPGAAPPQGVSVYPLGHLDAYLLFPNACHFLYGPGTRFSERTGPDRDQFNPATVSGLALWIEQPAVRGLRVVVDLPGGEAFNAGLTDAGLDVACIQPNRTMAELTVDWFTEESQVTDRRFFGVKPKDLDKQRGIIAQGLTTTADHAAIALLPELVTTQEEAADLKSVLENELAGRRLSVLISGSFHHTEGSARRNTTYVYFRDRVGGAIERRCHQKAGRFEFEVTEEAMKSMFGTGEDTTVPPQSKWMIGKIFREDVTAIQEIRLYSGARFSATVLICADLLNNTILTILQKLHVSLLLICNMTPKIEGFASRAEGLIASSQTTTLTVNNPALWPVRTGDVPVTGLLAEIPISDKRQIKENFPEGTRVRVFNTKAQAFGPPRPPGPGP